MLFFTPGGLVQVGGGGRLYRLTILWFQAFFVPTEPQFNKSLY